MSKLPAKNVDADTAQSKTNEQRMADMCLALASATKVLGDLLEASGKGSRTDVALARLEHQANEDVVLICDIKLVSRQGTIASIQSENTLPGALETHMLSASHGNFCNMLEAVITNPLVSNFQAFLTRKSKESKTERDTLDSFDGDHDFTGLIDDED